MNIYAIRMKPSTDNLYYAVALAAVFGVALFVRTYFPYDSVFTGDWVRFQWTDAWYHMRLVENLVHHFPHRICFDPYTLFPHGQGVHFAPFFDWFLGFFAWLFGAGSPSTKVVETVGAWFPAILGALITVPVYFTGKELFNKKAGLIAAALVAILPGEFLSRSLLGNTDHHVVEILLMTLTIMFLMLALKSARQKEISFNSIRSRDWISLRKPFVYSLLAGVALGFFLLSLMYGWFFVAIILVFAFIQFILDHLKGRSADYLLIILLPAFIIAVFLVIPYVSHFGISSHMESALYIKGALVYLSIGIIVLPVMSGISFFMAGKNMKRIYYPVILSALAIVFFAFLVDIIFFPVTSPWNVTDSLWPLSRYVFDKPAITQAISEARPLSQNLLQMSWDQFTTSFYLSLISLVLLACLVIKKGAAEKTLLLVWSVAMLGSIFMQIRFTYYFAVNASLLTGYLCWKALSLTGTIESPSEDKEKESKGKAGGSQLRGLRASFSKHPAARYALRVSAAAAILFLVFYPNIGKSIDIAGEITEPSQDWHDALVWLRDNSPEPFQDPDFYYAIYDRPAQANDSTDYEDYIYPESAYGVLSWWDSGHWITYISHRIPNINPHQRHVKDAALFFTSTDEATANRIIDKLGSRYVIIEQRMVLHEVTTQGPVGYFGAIVEISGKETSDFFERYYYQNEQGGLESILLYYPDYYRSMSSRLYLFGVENVVPADSTLVISYTEETAVEGTKFKLISSLQRFAAYEEALDFLELHGTSSYRIVGDNPLISPVPLEELEHYSLAYRSPTTVAIREGEPISEVEIFEYTP